MSNRRKKRFEKALIAYRFPLGWIQLTLSLVSWKAVGTCHFVSAKLEYI